MKDAMADIPAINDHESTETETQVPEAFVRADLAQGRSTKTTPRRP